MLALTSICFSQVKFETGDIEFNFKKTESFDEGVLLDIMLLPKEKYFSAVNLVEDMQRLNKYYFDNGFFDVIIDTVTRVNKEDNEVNVTFIIIENTRYTVKEIRMFGLDTITTGAKSEIAQNQILVPGEPYSRTKVTQEKDRIIGILQNHGYYFAQIDTARSRIDSSRIGIIIGKYSEALQKSPEFKDRVVIKLRFIGTKDIYSIGNVNIKINKNKYKIEKNVIERELKFKEGEVYNRDKIIESERNFTKLAIIQLGRVLADTVNHDTKKIDMTVNITLNNKYEITPGIGGVYLTNRFYLSGSVQYSDKDFFGGGRVFTIKLEELFNSISDNQTSLSFNLFQPFIFRNNMTANFNSTLGLLNYHDTLEYIFTKNLLRFTYFIADHTFYNNAYLDITYDHYRKRYKYDDYIPEGDSTIEAGTRISFSNSIVGFTLIHNGTNDIFNPTSGLYHQISVENAGGLSRLISAFNKNLLYSQYAKFYTPNKVFYDISGGRGTTIAAANIEIGDIIEYGSGQNIIAVDRLYKFFMGGGSSLRGWKAQSGGILDDPSDGGKFMLEGSFEIRRKPFPQRSFLHPVWAVVFLDWGNVWESDGRFRADQIALATGLGIRYDTFVGPIRIDLGFKLFDPLGGDTGKWIFEQPDRIFKNKYAIQFGLGNAF